MAYEEIPEPEYVGGKGQFVKASEIFKKVGDKFTGVYKFAAEGTFGLDVSFDTDQGAACLTVKGSLKSQIENAQLKKGDCVLIQFAKTVPSAYANPRKQFRVAVDRSFKGKPPANGKNVVVPVYTPENAQGAADPFAGDANEDSPF